MPESCKIICLGDIILDTYCDGLVERISPEAPIPILKVENDKKKDLGEVGTWPEILQLPEISVI